MKSQPRVNSQCSSSAGDKGSGAGRQAFIQRICLQFIFPYQPSQSSAFVYLPTLAVKNYPGYLWISLYQIRDPIGDTNLKWATQMNQRFLLYQVQ